MAKTINRSMILYKVKDGNFTNDRASQELQRICGRILTDTRKARGWSTRIPKDIEPKELNGTAAYMVKVDLICKPLRSRDEDATDREVAAMAEQASICGAKIGWQLAALDGVKRELVEPGQVFTGKATTYADLNIPEDWNSHFDHIFERDAQIEIIMTAVRAGLYSDWEDRLHCALVGDPAAGKSELLRSIRGMLGEEAVMEFDATATTQAGAIKNLKDREIMPRILLVEEIEKVEEAALRWLLGVLDFRAEIRKNNYRETVHKETKLLCLATVNDWQGFSKMMSGALASRFVNKVYCPRPTRALLEKILARDVAKVKDGKTEWIVPALDYAENNDITDPREVLAILKCGRDDLLTGKHQKRLDATSIKKFKGIV